SRRNQSFVASKLPPPIFEGFHHRLLRHMMQEAHQERTLPALLYLFTVVTGLVDAISYIALGHVFTANMTGNIVFLGFAAAGVPGLSALRSMAALAAFFLGALIGGGRESG